MERIDMEAHVGTVWMTTFGERIIVLHIDDISDNHYVFNYRKKDTTWWTRAAFCENVEGLWDEQWNKNKKIIEKICNDLAFQANAEIMENAEKFYSVSRDQYIQSAKITVEHQEYGIKRKVLMSGEDIKFSAQEMIDFFVNHIKSAKADMFVSRVPIEFNAFFDPLTAEVYIALYTRFSLVKDGKQIFPKWADRNKFLLWEENIEQSLNF